MPKKVTPEDIKNAQGLTGPEIISQGVTAELLRDKLLEELEATEIKAQIPKGQSKFVYSKPLPDMKIRQDARKDAHKLEGHYPAEKFEGELTLPNAMALTADYLTGKARNKPKKKRKKSEKA